MAVAAKPMYVMYLTGQHFVVPEPHLVSSITHVELAFMLSHEFNRPNPTSWPFYTTVDAIRNKFAPGTKVMVAIGGWGDTVGFPEAARTDASRKLFARNVKAMVDDTGADGVDIDWEYPGGNGEDYKKNPNSGKSWEVYAYPLLLSEIRTALGPSKVISAAVPGLERDMIAFTHDTVPLIKEYVDFFNIMTYDLMNRRDNITKHHTGIQLSLESIDAYLSRGISPSKMNLGFAFYVKWFRTDPTVSGHESCLNNPIGCKTALMEDPDTGDDLGQSGAFSWHDEVPSTLAQSFSKAKHNGAYDETGGGYYYWDEEENIWWTFDTPEAMKKKFEAIVKKKGLAGVFAWALGEDADDWKHLKAVNEGVEGMSGRGKEAQEHMEL